MAVSPVLVTARNHQAQLARLEAQATQRLIDAYTSSWQRLEAMLNALLLQIGTDTPTRAQLQRMREYERLIEQIANELIALQVMTENEIEEIARTIPPVAERNNREMMAIMALLMLGIANALPNQISQVAANDFTVVTPDALSVLTDWLRPGSRLYTRLYQLAGVNTQSVIDAILNGVVSGFNPRRTARLVQDSFGRGLADALRFVRTAQLWAYREASRASMVANQDVLEGWVWSAHFDDRVCMSCVVMHGTIHPVDEALNDHHNGRCAPIPLVKGFPNPVDQTGIDWFLAQPEATQKQLMGPGKYQAWQDGAIQLDQLTAERVDDVYGVMRGEPSLKQLLEVVQ